MSLKKINVLKGYINHGDNNLVESLINPALREACLYRRSVGFFSSSVFKLLINSLPYFIRNNGKIKLIVSPNLSANDIETIDLGYKKKEEMLEKSFLSDFESELDYFDDDSLKILYELVSKGILDIKIACVKNNYGIYHDKLGIISDKENNHIVFFGSPNSSESAYMKNYEKIRTAISWNPSDYDSINGEIEEFENLWNDNNEFVSVITFNESVKKSILKVRESKQFKKNDNQIELYDYQKEAISSWVNNGYNGFYVMATGTGKTWTAIYSSLELDKVDKTLLVIIAPYKHLIKQWQEDIKKVYKNAHIVMISDENPKWVQECTHYIISQKYNSNEKVIFISTIASFLSDKFGRVISKSSENKLLIVDEAHRFKQRSNEILTTFKYKLGLSATPINGKNNEEGISLMNFFGGRVFNLPIEEALKKKCLVNYYYKPFFVNATEEEEKKVSILNQKIISCFKNGDLIDKDRLWKLVKRRLNIISLSEEKQEKLPKILSEIAEKDHIIIYCGDGKLFEDTDDEIRHLQFVKETVDSIGISSSQFTYLENMDRRMELVEMFNNNDINSMVAIRCLDEGINIPSIKSALILSSNDDYREFVQRRGRILRKFEGKEFATIYDVIVLPSKEKKIAEIEFRRFYEYAKLSLNKDELLVQLNDYLDQYGLSIEDIEFDMSIEEEEESNE